MAGRCLFSRRPLVSLPLKLAATTGAPSSNWANYEKEAAGRRATRMKQLHAPTARASLCTLAGGGGVAIPPWRPPNDRSARIWAELRRRRWLARQFAPVRAPPSATRRRRNRRDQVTGGRRPAPAAAAVRSDLRRRIFKRAPMHAPHTHTFDTRRRLTIGRRRLAEGVAAPLSFVPLEQSFGAGAAVGVKRPHETPPPPPPPLDLNALGCVHLRDAIRRKATGADCTCAQPHLVAKRSVAILIAF